MSKGGAHLSPLILHALVVAPVPAKISAKLICCGVWGAVAANAVMVLVLLVLSLGGSVSPSACGWLTGMFHLRATVAHDP